MFVTGPLSPVLLIVAAVVGAVAILATPREEDPQIVVPMADVFVAFPGASAEEVEQLVATPLEKLLWQVQGVEHVYSISRRDGALVMVRFFVGEDRERALVRVQSQIDGHRDEAPRGVSGWVVRPVDIDDVPIVSLTLWSPTLDDAGLRRLAEELAARLDPTPDLSRTDMIGGRPREVRAEVDPEALAGHGLSPLGSGGCGSSPPMRPSAPGAFDRADRHLSVLAGPFVENRQAAEQLVVGAWGDRPIHLRDVATVIDGPREATSYVRLTFGPAGAPSGVQVGQPFSAVTLAFAKKRGTNAVGVADDLVERAHALEAEILPADVHLLVTRNYGETANEKVNELLRELALAIVTVTGLIAFALGWREGLIVAAAVPITFALTLFVNLLAGYTINRVTLFALVLVLGLVCDDPIVDVENIHRHFALRKRSPLESVLVAVNEVRPPVIVATLAVIISFLPMFFITGMMGPYMRPMALNVPGRHGDEPARRVHGDPVDGLPDAQVRVRPRDERREGGTGRALPARVPSLPRHVPRTPRGPLGDVLDDPRAARARRWSLCHGGDPAQDAALRQQERAPGRARPSRGDDPRSDQCRRHRRRTVPRHRARGDQLHRVRRYGEPDRFQWIGPPLRLPPRPTPRRRPRELRIEGAPDAAESCDRPAAAPRPGGDRRAPRREAHDRGGAARPSRSTDPGGRGERSRQRVLRSDHRECATARVSPCPRAARR